MLASSCGLCMVSAVLKVVSFSALSKAFTKPRSSGQGSFSLGYIKAS